MSKKETSKSKPDIVMDQLKENPELLLKLINDNPEIFVKSIDENPEVKESIISQELIAEARMYQGPIPDPDILKGYADIDPSYPDRIIKMTESQVAHRHSIENKIVDGNIKTEKLGMIIAFIIVLVGFGVGTFLIYNEREASGMASILTPLVSIIAVFAYNKYKATKDEK